MNQHKKVWIYCRVANPDTIALEKQKRLLMDYSEQQSFEVVGITAETAHGSSIKRRGMADVFSAASKQRIDILLVVNPDRITRKTSEFLGCAKKLNGYGVEILTPTSGVVGLPEADFYARIAGIAKSMNG